MKEFAFDVTLKAVVRVSAQNEEAARDAMDAVLEACEPSEFFRNGFNSVSGVKLTEFSLTNDRPHLFQQDGVDVNGG